MLSRSGCLEGRARCFVRRGAELPRDLGASAYLTDSSTLGSAEASGRAADCPRHSWVVGGCAAAWRRDVDCRDRCPTPWQVVQESLSLNFQEQVGTVESAALAAKQAQAKLSRGVGRTRRESQALAERLCSAEQDQLPHPSATGKESRTLEGGGENAYEIIRGSDSENQRRKGSALQGRRSLSRTLLVARAVGVERNGATFES